MSLLAVHTYSTNHFTTAEFICASILASFPGLRAQLLSQTLGTEAWVRNEAMSISMWYEGS